ncbi:MAG: hypothetical protein PVSMB7_23330 [Chloroflexota bacterium]
MIYTNPITHQPEDTATIPLACLAGALESTRRRTVRAFIRLNGADSVTRLCRAVRARYFRERQVAPAWMRNYMNRIDPPACRCGQRSTHVLLDQAFCSACGPTTAMQTQATSWHRREDLRRARAARHAIDVDQARRRKEAVRRTSLGSKHGGRFK